jgi:hypothetical protein
LLVDAAAHCRTKPYRSGDESWFKPILPLNDAKTVLMESSLA